MLNKACIMDHKLLLVTEVIFCNNPSNLRETCKSDCIVRSTNVVGKVTAKVKRRKEKEMNEQLP